MFFSKKRLTLMLSLFCLLISVIEYIPQHILFTTGSAVTGVISQLISAAVGYMLPVLFAAVLLVRSADRSMPLLLLDLLFMSLPRLAFYAPGFYIDFSTRGLQLWDAILTALLFALLAAVGFGLFTLILYGISLLVYNRRRKSYKKGKAPSMYDMLKDDGVFDFSHGSVALLAPSVIFAFIINLPIVETVQFFISYGSSFIFSEILSIIFEFLLLVLLLLLTQYTVTRFVKALMAEVQ